MAETTDRDVVLKLKTKMETGGDEALKQVARSTRDTDKAEAEYQERLKGRLNAYREALRMKQDLAKMGIGQELSEEEKYQQRLKARIAAYHEAKRMKQDLAKQGIGEDSNRPGGAGGLGSMLGTFGLPASALGALMLASNEAKDGNRNKYTSFGRTTRESFETGVSQRLEDLPLLGHAFAASNQSRTRRDREREVADAEFNLRSRQLQARGGAQRDTALYGLRGQSLDVQLGAAGQAFSQQQQFDLTRRATPIVEGALAGAGKTAGYGRQEEEQDISRRMGMELNLQRQQIEAERERVTIEQQLKANAEEEAVVRKKAADATLALRTTGQAMRGATNEKDYQTRSLQLQAQMVEYQAQQQRLEQLTNQSLELRVQHNQTLQQQGQQRLALLGQERDALTSIANQEKSRLQGMKENFGMQIPMHRQAGLHVARKLAGGQELTAKELEFARGNQELFGDALRKRGAANAGPEFEEIKRLLGLDARQKQAEEARVKLDQQIKIQVDMNAQAVAQQVTQQIVPAVAQAMQEARVGILAEVTRQLVEMARQRVAGFGGQ